MSKLRVLDLFSGIGGFSLGLERTGGFETVAFCEIEPYPRAVLKKHWPEVPCYEDVRTLTADALARDGIAVDVICGGFPCQDISFAGKGAGLAGERSGLWREYARLIGELRPQYVIVENVAALLGRGLGAVLGDLAALGYDAEWHCIPASAVGAPHRRDRLWLVAYPECAKRREVGNARQRLAWEECLSQWQESPSWSRGSGEDAADAATLLRTEVKRCKQNRDHQRAEALADAACNGRKPRRASDAEKISGRRQSNRGGISSQSMAHSELSGCERRDTEWGWASSALPSGWWITEPDVGGGSDGFPVWLHRCVGWGLSNAESARRAKVLRQLWNANVSQALWRAAGGLERLSQAEVLFSFVREYEAGTHEARLLVSSSKAPKAFLRSLRQRAISRSAPRRSRQAKQRADEHSDAMQSMPRLLARDCQADWTAYSWEDAVPRVSTGTLNRVDRLRGLGNAVVPQIPELIGRAILQAEKGMSP